MLFSDHPRTHYRNAPAHEVICQLRFPSILTINSVEPPRITGLGSPNP